MIFIEQIICVHSILSNKNKKIRYRRLVYEVNSLSTLYKPTLTNDKCSLIKTVPALIPYTVNCQLCFRMCVVNDVVEVHLTNALGLPTTDAYYCSQVPACSSQTRNTLSVYLF